MRETVRRWNSHTCSPWVSSGWRRAMSTAPITHSTPEYMRMPVTPSVMDMKRR